MKKLFVYIVFCIGISTLAQDYKPLLGTTNEWNIVRSFEATYTEFYYAENKVTIDNNVYSKLYFMDKIFEVGYVREDTVEKKVYLRSKENNEIGEEYLLYDFSLNVNDTILLFTFEYTHIDTAGNFKLDSIGMFKSLIDERRIYYFSRTSQNEFFENLVWVEGIGSIGNFLLPGYGVEEGVSGKLSCFFKDGEHIYQSPDYSSCQVSMNIDPLAYKTGVENYPNPFENDITIEFKSLQKGAISIINQLGQPVYYIAFNETEKLELDLSHLKNGMYMVLINNGKEVVRRNVVKIGE